MALKDVKTKRGMGAFENEVRSYRSTYKFSDDGGLFADEFVLLEADQDMIIVEGYVHVKDAFLSGGAPTVIIGINGGDVDLILQSQVKAALTLNATFDLDSAAKSFFLAKGEKITMDLGVADLDAGELEVVLLAIPA